MNEDKSTGSPTQEPPTSANERSVVFLDVFGGFDVHGLFLAGSIPGDKPLVIIGHYTEAALRKLPDNQRHHVTAAVYPPGLVNRDDDKIVCVPFIVFDDIGKKIVSAPGTTSITDGIEIDEDAFDMVAEPSWKTETRRDRYQFGYHFEPALTPDQARFIHKALKRHPIFGPGLHAVGQYFRLPTGTNTKPDGRDFRTRLAHVGQSWTFGMFCREFGIDPMAKSPPGVTGQGSATGETLSPEAVGELLALIPNNRPEGGDPRKGRHYDEWTRTGLAIWGATGGKGFEQFDEWSQTSDKYNADLTREKWDSYSSAKGSASTLRKIIEEIHGVDSEERREANRIFDADRDVEFPDLDEETLAAAGTLAAAAAAKADKETPPASAFDLSDWNPWEASGGRAFPLDLLPETLRDFIAERSTTTGTSTGAFAMSVLTGMSVAVDHRVKLQPKVHDTHYLISPLLWSLLVGDPSTRKSVPIDTMEKLLSKFDHRDAMARQYEVADQMATFGLSKKDAEKAVPPSRRRVLYDSTTEKLCAVLAGQDCGCGLFRDELSGWIGAMDKYGGGGKGSAQDRGVWIKAHGGGRYIQDRIGDTRVVANLSSAILGAVQPAALGDMGKLDTDGLLQRFLPVMMSSAGKDRDVPVDAKVWSRFQHLMEKLDKVGGDTGFVVALSPEAQAIRAAFADEMVEASGLREPSVSFGSFMGKQERTLCVLALLLHLVERVEGRVEGGEPVSEETMSRSLGIMWGFVIPHAWTFYTSLDSKWSRAVEAVAADVVKHCGEGRVTQSTFRSREVRGMSLKEFQDVMRVFQANGWAIAKDNGALNSVWWLNPNVAKMEKELADYHARCEVVTKKIMKEARKTP